MIGDWSVPFTLTASRYSATPLAINQLIPGLGYYLLRADGCRMRNTVRAQKNDIPQADGEILHRRFTAGVEMDLTFQFWESPDAIACDDRQQEMIDDLMGYLYALLNAGDNEGRISWVSYNDTDERMLDDIRLLTYPEVTQLPNALGVELSVTVDTAWPYAMNLTPQTPTLNVGSTNVTNAGNRPLYPVFRIYSGQFVLANTTTGYQFVFDETQPGVPTTVGAGYVEINTLRNTVYLNGDGANMKAGIVVQESDFFLLNPGVNTISLNSSSGTSTVEHNNAWA